MTAIIIDAIREAAALAAVTVGIFTVPYWLLCKVVDAIERKKCQKAELARRRRELRNQEFMTQARLFGEVITAQKHSKQNIIVKNGTSFTDEEVKEVI